MRILCVNCQIELRPKKNGVDVLTMSHQPAPAPPTPYQAFQADLYRCPGCGLEVVAGFALHPWGEHYQEDFGARLKQRASLFHDYERAEDVPSC